MTGTSYPTNTFNTSLHRYIEIHKTNDKHYFTWSSKQGKEAKCHCSLSRNKLKPKEWKRENHYTTTTISIDLCVSLLVTFPRKNYSCKPFYLCMGSFLLLPIQRQGSSDFTPSGVTNFPSLLDHSHQHYIHRDCLS